MWFYNDKEFTSEEIGDAIGFVYEIEDTHTGMSYIGKKRFWSTKRLPPLKGKKRKRKVVKESDWQDYFGSSKEVQGLLEESGRKRFHRKILRICYYLGEMSYFETKEHFDRDVLFHPEKYYNSFVGCRIHRNHVSNVKNAR